MFGLMGLKRYDLTTAKFFLLLIFSVTVILYIPSISSPFVRDDFNAIVNNMAFKLSQDPGEILFNEASHTSRPVFSFVNWLQFKLFGPDPFPFHVFNLFIHLLNGFLVFLLFARIKSSPGKGDMSFSPAVIMAVGIFLLHPLQVESVAHVSSRSGMLMATFYLISLWLFAEGRYLRLKHLDQSEKLKKRRLRLAALWSSSFVAAVIAQFCKESAATLILSLFGLSFLLKQTVDFGRKVRIFSLREMRVYIPFVIPTLIVPVMFLVLPYTHRSIGFEVRDFWLHLITQWKILGMLIFKFFVPISLNFDYNISPAGSVFELPALAGLATILIISALSWRFREKVPWFIVGWGFFLLMVAPTNSFLPSRDLVAERHLYLPLVGLSFASGALIEKFFPRRGILLTALIGIYFSIFTLHRNMIWSDDVKLYSDTVKKSPGKERPLWGLEQALFFQGRFLEHVHLFEKITENANFDIETLNASQGKVFATRTFDAGISYFVLGEYKKAIEMFDRATFASGRRDAASLLKGLSLLGLKETLAAGRLFAEKHQISLNDQAGFYAFAKFYQKRKKQKEACSYFRIACGLYYPPACREGKAYCVDRGVQ